MGVLSSGLFTIWAVTSLHYRWLRALGFAALTLVVFFGFCYMGLRGGWLVKNAAPPPKQG
jgi:hypothetical protein